MRFWSASDGPATANNKTDVVQNRIRFRGLALALALALALVFQNDRGDRRMCGGGV
ncbi:hypothetical protein BVRB_7g170960 [Beta vulgaris subsp. vulgaris]|nr:hypothetical protein BVRB_7g170960 [Beta vulgaris subsp. vulgaris]